MQCTGEGNYVIRVDHSSDIAILRGEDPAVVLIMQSWRKERSSAKFRSRQCGARWKIGAGLQKGDGQT
jgi:hypothetical protein